MNDQGNGRGDNASDNIHGFIEFLGTVQGRRAGSLLNEAIRSYNGLTGRNVKVTPELSLDGCVESDHPGILQELKRVLRTDVGPISETLFTYSAARRTTQDILDFFKQNRNTVDTATGLAKRIGKNGDLVEECLEELVRGGIVARSSSGKGHIYMLSESR